MPAFTASSFACVGFVATRPIWPVSCTIFRKSRAAYAMRTPGVFISEWMLPVSRSTRNLLLSCE